MPRVPHITRVLSCAPSAPVHASRFDVIRQFWVSGRCPAALSKSIAAECAPRIRFRRATGAAARCCGKRTRNAASARNARHASYDGTLIKLDQSWAEDLVSVILYTCNIPLRQIFRYPSRRIALGRFSLLFWLLPISACGNSLRSGASAVALSSEPSIVRPTGPLEARSA